MRWFHEAVDHLHVALLHRIIPPVFQHGIDSPSLSAHLAAVRLTLPALTATRHYTVLAHTLIGEVAAGFQVRWGPQPDLPVLCTITALLKCLTIKVFVVFFEAPCQGKPTSWPYEPPFIVPGLTCCQDSGACSIF
jgi:hypothetical protein